MTTPACPGRYDDETTGRAIPCQWNHDPDGMHHAHDRTRCVVWTEGAAGINTAANCPGPPAQQFGQDARQPAWDAVYGYLRTLPRDQLPTSIVERNAVIWRAVNAALVALGYEDTEQRPTPLADALRDQVLTEAAALIQQDQQDREAAELARFSELDHETVLQTAAVNRAAQVLLNARTTKEN